MQLRALFSSASSRALRRLTRDLRQRQGLQRLKLPGAVIGACALLVGCSGYRMERAAAPSLALAASSSGQANICVFRPHGLGTSVVSPVSDNGVLVGATEGSSYFCYLAEPGKHQIKTADAPKLSLEVVAQRDYYLAHDLNVGPDTLVRITRQSAQQLTAWCGSMQVGSAPKDVVMMKAGAVARAEVPRAQPARAIATKQLQPGSPSSPQAGAVAANRPSKAAATAEPSTALPAASSN